MIRKRRDKEMLRRVRPGLTGERPRPQRTAIREIRRKETRQGNNYIERAKEMVYIGVRIIYRIRPARAGLEEHRAISQHDGRRNQLI